MLLTIDYGKIINIIIENLKRDILYPQDITIAFSNNKKIFISAAEFKGEEATMVSRRLVRLRSSELLVSVKDKISCEM